MRFVALVRAGQRARRRLPAVREPESDSCNFLLGARARWGPTAGQPIILHDNFHSAAARPHSNHRCGSNCALPPLELSILRMNELYAFHCIKFWRVSRAIGFVPGSRASTTKTRRFMLVVRYVGYTPALTLALDFHASTPISARSEHRRLVVLVSFCYAFVLHASMCFDVPPLDPSIHITEKQVHPSH